MTLHRHPVSHGRPHEETEHSRTAAGALRREFEQAVGGRYRNGAECPSDFAIHRAAGSEARRVMAASDNDDPDTESDSDKRTGAVKESEATFAGDVPTWEAIREHASCCPVCRITANASLEAAVQLIQPNAEFVTRDDIRQAMEEFHGREGVRIDESPLPDRVSEPAKEEKKTVRRGGTGGGWSLRPSGSSGSPQYALARDASNGTSEPQTKAAASSKRLIKVPLEDSPDDFVVIQLPSRLQPDGNAWTVIVERPIGESGFAGPVQARLVVMGENEGPFVDLAAGSSARVTCPMPDDHSETEPNVDQWTIQLKIGAASRFQYPCDSTGVIHSGSNGGTLFRSDHAGGRMVKLHSVVMTTDTLDVHIRSMCVSGTSGLTVCCGRASVSELPGDWWAKSAESGRVLGRMMRTLGIQRPRVHGVPAVAEAQYD